MQMMSDITTNLVKESENVLGKHWLFLHKIIYTSQANNSFCFADNRGLTLCLTLCKQLQMYNGHRYVFLYQKLLYL